MTDRSVAGQPVIRTPDQRLRVFVSSTLEELAPERAAVRAAVERLHLTPVMFELGARPHPPRSLYRAYLAQSHVFLGVYWQRYGWVAPGEVASGLEDEYRLSSGMPRLLYLKEPAPDREPRLHELLGRFVADDRAAYKRFTTPEELARLVEDDLAVLLTERFETAGAAGGTDGRAHGRHPDSTPPVPLTVTVGREREIVEVADLLAAGTRLVTITGPGGTGKSRLALEVARRLGPRVVDGVWFVPLEPLGDAAGLHRAIADRVGATGQARRPLLDTLAEHFGGWQAVLLLDNFEHVIDAATDLAALLDRAPGVRALVTSRRPLRLRGEHEYPLAPLQVPSPGARDAADTAAVELFVQRARSVRPDFVLTDDALPTVAELVRRLDGLPLAIELAAARIRLLPPAALLERLEERLDLLSSGAVDLPERQRTLRATIHWSYSLLDPDEQRLLERLSVFVGGATIEAAEAVCGEPGAADVLETLSSLLEKSLLLSTTEAGGEPRVQMLNTVRAYARERLQQRGEAAVIADRHADWFLGRASTVDPTHDPSAHQRFDALMQEADDVRAAMEWALERRDVLRTATFAQATWMWFWITGRVADVLPWFESAASLADEPAVPARCRASLLYALGQLREITGDPVGSEEVMAPAIELLRELGVERAVAGGLVSLSAGAPDRGHPEHVLEFAQAALEIGERVDDPYVVAFAAANVGTARMIAGDLEGARAAHRRCLRAARSNAFAPLEAQALGQLALVDALDGRLEVAWQQLRAASVPLAASQNREGLGYWLESAGVASLLGDEPVAAVEALTTAEVIRDEMAMTIWPQLQPLHERWLGDARAQLVDDGPVAVAEPSDPWALMATLLAAHGATTAVAPHV